MHYRPMELRRRDKVRSTADLLDESIRHCARSIALQLEAKKAEDGGDSNIVQVGPGDSLFSVLDGLSGGETVYVSPEVRTYGDFLITKPVTLVGARIWGLTDIQCPDVSLIGCSFTGPHENGAIIATGPNLFMQGCRLHGSPTGQHRGIYLRSDTAKIYDSSIVGIWKSGQETQSIAGWSGVRNVMIDGCLLEAAGINFIIGGTDCPENMIPENITIQNCYLRKPNEWRGKGYNCKNLLEVKNVKHFKALNNFMEYSWVEGQIGFAIVVTVRNQEGTAPWSTLEDILIKGNKIRHVAGAIQYLGRDYLYPSQVVKHVSFEDNIFEAIDPNWGGNQRCMQLSWGGEDIAFRRNTFSGREINSFLTFEGTPFVRFTYEGNVAPEGYYGAKSDDMVIGLPTLDKYVPDRVWTDNTVIRTIHSNNYQYPVPGTTIVYQ